MLLFVRRISADERYSDFPGLFGAKRLHSGFGQGFTKEYPMVVASRKRETQLRAEKGDLAWEIRSGDALPVAKQLELANAILNDDVPGFERFFLRPDPKSVTISRAACPDARVWQTAETKSYGVLDFALAAGAEKVVRASLGYFNMEVGHRSMTAAMCSGDTGLVSLVWTRTGEQRGLREKWLHHATVMKWAFNALLNEASDEEMDHAFEELIFARILWPLPYFKRIGYDFGRPRAVRSLARWRDDVVGGGADAGVRSPIDAALGTRRDLAWTEHCLRIARAEGERNAALQRPQSEDRFR
jgi:hypothetical protein